MKIECPSASYTLSYQIVRTGNKRISEIVREKDDKEDNKEDNKEDDKEDDNAFDILFTLWYVKNYPSCVVLSKRFRG